MAIRPESRSAPVREDAALEAARDDNARLRGELVRLSAECERLRAELHDARTLEAVGRLAAGVAHDFKNLVAAIAGYGRLLASRIPAGDTLRESVEGIQGAAEWGATLTRQLLAACRQQRSPAAVVNVDDVVAGANAMLRLLVGEANELVTRLDAEACPVRMSLGRLEQVITYLVANAREALPAGGRITITTARADVADAEAAALELSGAGRYVVLSVSDTSPGGDAATQARLCQSHVAAKKPGTGELGTRGLGLAAVRDIVAQSSGAIRVTGLAGQGSTFEVYLPACGAEPRSETASDAPTAPLEGTETVLVVEDEHAVRELIRDVLRLHGYTVIEARDGSEAIAVGERHAGPIHLLVLDFITPGASSATVIERLRARRPDVRHLHISGHPGEMLRDRGLVRLGRDFLQKPFTVDALARKVREVLDRP